MKLTKKMKHMVGAVTGQLGDIPYTIEKTRKHIKVRFCHNGRNETIVVPASVSDFRAARNARATTNRVLRGKNV